MSFIRSFSVDPTVQFEMEGGGFRPNESKWWFNTNEVAPSSDGIYVDSPINQIIIYEEIII